MHAFFSFIISEKLEVLSELDNRIIVTNQTVIMKHRPVASGWRVSRTSVATCTCIRVGHNSEFPTSQNLYEDDVCKYREYWTCEKMKMSKGLLGGRSRYQGDLRTAKNPRIKNSPSRLQLDLWPLKIKWSGGTDQAIEHTFCQPKNLIAVANTSTGDV